MNTYKVEFENNKAVSFKKTSKNLHPANKEFALEGQKKVVKWCLIEAANEKDLLAKANKYIRDQWGYALGLK